MNKEIELEEQLYNSLTVEECLGWHGYIVSQFSTKAQSDIESLMLQDYSDWNKRRILNRINQKINSSDVVKKEIADKLRGEGVRGYQQVADNNTIIIETENDDLINAYLLFLQETLQKKENFGYKEKLIESKYKIESNMVSNNFDIPKELYICKGLVIDFINLMIYKTNIKNMNITTKDKVYIDYQNQQMTEMLKISTQDNDEQYNDVTLILRQCMLKASLLLMSDKSRTIARSNFLEYIDIVGYSDDEKNIKLIIECFDKDKGPRGIVKILSLFPSDKKNN